ncbi:hypothetical protein HRD49_08650 [Corallococcus exiguus]|uniref:hypothetical protein n=1 Tax=Corallococcus TaxID=83461 RepID=UPI000EA34949|nr:MULTISPECIES: hypothetical protein [Corallococcus]NRD58910.1 hypothetical protein [Corallococcus exiguus]NRD61825.1 hypothetical protein [Corallococcus exiguus]RKH30689.1 hypothetical protein D7V77_02435 [Corallococcus sp. CA041A]RKI14936.1 hypothetical protein D7Y15_14200 [Corallococcus sp. AB030]RUO94916.1 hypothetical protein D7Y11_02105 [Corallococcus sp. AB018]
MEAVTVEEVFEQALKLPPLERAWLAYKLLLSLDENTSGSDASQEAFDDSMSIEDVQRKIAEHLRRTREQL